MRNRMLLALMFLAASGHVTLAQRVETGFLNRMANVGGQGYRYQVYVPADYTSSTDWPVILFLHGAGERGSDGILQTTTGLAPAIRRNPSRFPAIVVFPQVPTGSAWDDAAADAAMVALRQTMAEYRVDVDRVYLTGLSMGGRGSWYLAYRNPTVFAAVAPICGWITQSPTLTSTPVIPPDSGPPFAALARQLRDMPVWIFHGEMDRVVPVIGSREPAAALKEAGGTVRYTEYLGTDHNSWDMTYASKEFVDWLFSQRRPAAPAQARQQPATPSSFDTRDEREAFLANARAATDPPVDGRPTWRASLDDGIRKHDASVATEDGRGPTPRNYRFNLAAYELDKLLGLNLVPPSVERPVNGRPAFLIWWIDNFAMSEVDRRRKQIEPPDQESWRRQVQAVRVFDELISNAYRDTEPALYLNICPRNNWTRSRFAGRCS